MLKPQNTQNIVEQQGQNPRRFKYLSEDWAQSQKSSIGRLISFMQGAKGIVWSNQMGIKGLGFI